MISARWIAVVVGLLVLRTSLAFAQAEAEEASTEPVYEAALSRALAAHAAGHYLEAEAAMREAHALSPNARTLRGLGVILYAEGRYVEAIAPLEAALVSERKPLGPELRAGVDELLARIWRRVGLLTLNVEPASREVRIDGAAPVLHGTEIVLAVGEHQVEITAPGRAPYALRLRTQAGSRDSLHVLLAAASAQPAAPAAEPRRERAAEPLSPMRASETRHDERWTPRARTGLLVGGGTLLVAGAASWLTAFARFERLADDCMERDGCEQEWAEQRYEAEHILPLNAAGIALVSAGAATLFAVGAVELWRWRAERRRHGAPALRLGAAGTTLSLRAQF